MPYRISDVMKTHSPHWVLEFTQKMQMDMIIARSAISDQENDVKHRLPGDDIASAVMLFDNPGYHMKDVANEILSELDSVDISREWNMVASVLDELTWSPETMKGYISISKVFDQHFGASMPVAERLREQMSSYRNNDSSSKSYEEVMASGLIVEDMTDGYYGAVDLARMRYGDVCSSVYSRMRNLVKEDKEKKDTLRSDIWNMNSNVFKNIVVSLSMRQNYVASFAAEAIVTNAKSIIELTRRPNEAIFQREIHQSTDEVKNENEYVHCPKEISNNLLSHMIDSSFLHELHSKEAITGSDFKNAVDINGLDINELLGEVYYRSPELGEKLSGMLESSGIEASPESYAPPSSTEGVVESFRKKEIGREARKELLSNEEKGVEKTAPNEPSIDLGDDLDYSPS